MRCEHYIYLPLSHVVCESLCKLNMITHWSYSQNHLSTKTTTGPYSWRLRWTSHCKYSCWVRSLWFVQAHPLILAHCIPVWVALGSCVRIVLSSSHHDDSWTLFALRNMWMIPILKYELEVFPCLLDWTTSRIGKRSPCRKCGVCCAMEYGRLGPHVCNVKKCRA